MAGKSGSTSEEKTVTYGLFTSSVALNGRRVEYNMRSDESTLRCEYH